MIVCVRNSPLRMIVTTYFLMITVVHNLHIWIREFANESSKVCFVVDVIKSYKRLLMSDFKGTVKLQVFFAEKDTPSVYEQRDVFLFPKFHL